jgi:hypothetical protein
MTKASVKNSMTVVRNRWYRLQIPNFRAWIQRVVFYEFRHSQEAKRDAVAPCPIIRLIHFWIFWQCRTIIEVETPILKSPSIGRVQNTTVVCRGIIPFWRMCRIEGRLAFGLSRVRAYVRRDGSNMFYAMIIVMRLDDVCAETSGPRAVASKALDNRGSWWPKSQLSWLSCALSFFVPILEYHWK